jgi:hypothetical protein
MIQPAQSDRSETTPDVTDFFWEVRGPRPAVAIADDAWIVAESHDAMIVQGAEPPNQREPAPNGDS